MYMYDKYSKYSVLFISWTVTAIMNYWAFSDIYVILRSM